MRNFEKNMRDKLHEYPSNMDTARLWEGVQQELHGPKRRRRRLLWLWLLLGLGLSAGGGAYLWQIGERSTRQDHTRAGEGNPRPVPAPTPSLFSAPASDTPVDARSAQGEANSVRAAGPKGAYPRIESKALTLSGVANTVPDLLVKNEGPDPGASAFPGSPDLSAVATLPVHDEASDSVWEKGRGPEIGLADPSQARVAVLALLPIAPSALSLPGIPRPRCADFSKPNRGRKGQGHGRLFSPFVSVHAVGAYPLRSLSAAVADSALLARQRGSERTLDAWGAGIGLGVTHRSGLGMEAGIEYLQLNERFRHTTRSVDTIGLILVRYIIINAPGDTSVTETLEPIIQDTRTERVTYNRYRLLNLPVSVQYAFPTQKAWQPYIRAGALINLSMSYKAEIFPNGEASSVLYRSESGSADSPFRSRLSVSPFGAVGLRYNLNRRISLFGELSYRRPGGSLTRADYAVSRRYGLPGAGIGIRVR